MSNLNEVCGHALTDNELKALVALVQCCLDGMGGSRPADLEDDPYTWCDVLDLERYGYNKYEAAGTYGALAEKGLIWIDDDGDIVQDASWRALDANWPELVKMID